MTLKREQMARLSRLLDEALALDEAGRRQWLQDLPAEHQELADSLRAALFPEPAHRDSLSTLPKINIGLDPPIAAGGLREGARVGPYRVLSLLGYGGMGSVWLAERADGLFTRQVALKLIHPALKSRVMSERFTREREILASLNHPHIAQLLDAGFTEDGQSYLALEYIAGTTLTTYCDEQHLGVRQRLELFRQVLSAVQYAHAHLVIHRDLKPSNILVTEEGQVQLLDFGIAKLLTEGEAKETELTQLGGRALTPDYAAPEQIAGAPVTTAADVYALGVMLYELLTGERPYKLKRDSRGALEEAILGTDPVAPSRAALSEAAAAARATTANKLSSTLRGDLDTIAIKALKKVATERYATVNAFGEDIERFLRGDVVLAQPDSTAYRALKFARRHWVGIAVASALILTLTGGLAATAYEARIASKQRDAALQAQLRSLTQTAAGRIAAGDVSIGLNIFFEILPYRASTRPYPPEALNAFQEARAMDTELLALTGHANVVRSARFSSDGRRIVTGSSDHTARIWDSVTGRELRRLTGHAETVRSAVFSPDGASVLTASNDKTARIWDAATGRQIEQFSGHADRLRYAAYSPDGQRVVTASVDKTVRIWNVATGEQILQLSGHEDVVNSAEFSPDGERIVSASGDKTVRVWDAKNGRQKAIFTGHSDGVSTAEFSPDGQRVVSSSVDKTARIWDAATGRQLQLLSGHTQLLISAAFSPDGQRVVTASDDKTIRIWDAGSGRQTMLLLGQTAQTSGAAFSPNGERVVSGWDDATARVWDVSMHHELSRLSGHTQFVDSAVYSDDGEKILTASNDRTARIWDVRTGRELVRLVGHSGPVEASGFSPGALQVVTSSYDTTARIWDASTGRQLLVIDGHKYHVTSAAFSRDGRSVVTASNDKTARMWDAASGRQLAVFRGHTDAVNSAAFSSDGKYVVTASLDKTARIWDTATGQQKMLLGVNPESLEYALFSADGRRVITASDDKTAQIWDAATGRRLVVLRGHRLPVSYAAFSPDGARVVTASVDRTARLWDAATGEQLAVLAGHESLLESAVFSPDGHRILTASDDTTVRIWDADAADLDTQLAWAEAAQFDELSVTDRYELGLPPPIGVRSWPEQASSCDAAAAAPYDPSRRAPGAMQDYILPELATKACADPVASAGNAGRSAYQHGRVQMANGDMEVARQDFERAIELGYESAAVDLGLLLASPSAGMLDPRRALALEEQAWREGVTMGEFELGELYAEGIRDAAGHVLLAADESQALARYEKAAQAGQPSALARLAERAEDAALAANSAADRTLALLDAFKLYAAAAQRARSEDWPDPIWRNWRYRRASLARVLAREGKMPEVARIYSAVRGQYAVTPPALWKQ
jgi:WD40 repeat protein/serine/threonine protein kinase